MPNSVSTDALLKRQHMEKKLVQKKIINIGLLQLKTNKFHGPLVGELFMALPC